MRPVLTKSDFVRRYAAGEFGNCAPTWNNLTEWEQRDNRFKSSDLYHIRNRVAGGPTWYDVKGCDLCRYWEHACERQDPSTLYISSMVPKDVEHTLLLQGEVWRTAGGLYLTYSQVALPMREALTRETKHAEGLAAVILLAKYLCPNSQDWLEYLLDEYDEHVVEFSTFRKQWGTLPHYNTLFWEVRKY